MGDMTATREAYGRALCEFGGREELVVFDADLSVCTMSCYFARRYPERFFNAGIAEANMTGMAAGAASTGRQVFCHSFAIFSTGRAYEQVRNSVAYPGLDVKIVGTHAGISPGEDGATHQCIEDLSLMRTIPNMTVVCPCDANETREAVRALLDYHGPCYLRLGRSPVLQVTEHIDGYKFRLGKGCWLRRGKDVTVIAVGLTVQIALQAAQILEEQGISAGVIDMPTVKPIDRDIILEAAQTTGAIVTTEEHNIIGGLGAAVAEVICETCPVPVIRHGVEDVFGHSGSSDAVLRHYGLTPERLVEKVHKALKLR